MKNLSGSVHARLASFSAVAFLVLCEMAVATNHTYSLAPATDGIVEQVKSVLLTILPIAGGLIALTIGWKLLKKMTKSA